MARTWDSRIREVERNADNRLNDELVRLAQDVGRIVQRYASGRDDSGEAIVPNRRRVKDNLRQDVWEQAVKPYFIGEGSDPLKGNQPQSPYMRTMVGGITEAVTVQAERQVTLIRKYAPDDVFAWLTGPRPVSFQIREMATPSVANATPPPNIGEEVPSPPTPLPLRSAGEGSKESSIVAETSPLDLLQGLLNGKVFGYDPFHLFVDENGYRLSDRGWRTANEARRAIDALLDQHIALGTSAVRMAELLEVYLYPGARRITTKTPYGEVGSYWARRLSRTEITAAAGRATVNMAIANPYAGLVDWALSLSHPDTDICDDYAAAGPYLPTEVPGYVPHPHCLCTLIALAVENPAAVTAQLRDWMFDTPPIGEDYPFDLQGAFNLEWLIAALLSGAFMEQVLRQ